MVRGEKKKKKKREREKRREKQHNDLFFDLIKEHEIFIAELVVYELKYCNPNTFCTFRILKNMNMSNSIFNVCPTHVCMCISGLSRKLTDERA